MLSDEFQKLLETIEKGDFTQFEEFYLYYKDMDYLNLSDLEEFNKIVDDREKCYYLALSKLLSLLSLYKSKGDELTKYNEFDQLIKYSDEFGILLETKKIPFRYKILSELHIDGLKIGLTSRIIELVSFFNKYNLFERKLTAEELKIIQEIKEDDKLLVTNLNDLFGKVSDSLIFYVCKVMSYDYVKWIRDRYKYENYHERGGVLDPNFLKNWTDYFSLYGLSVRNLGRVEDFIKIVETRQNSDRLNEEIITLEFGSRNIYNIYEDRILRESPEIHLVYPEIIIQNKENILNKDNYNFYSLSTVIRGGLGPEGFGFTYSTPRGEIVEICFDQGQTDAGAYVKFKEFLTRKFLNNLKEELLYLDIGQDNRKRINDFCTDILKSQNLESNNNKNLIIRKIRSFLFEIEETQNQSDFELGDLIDKISKAVSIIFSDIKPKDQFKSRMELIKEGKLRSEDIAKMTSLRGKTHYDVLRERIFLQNKPKWLFKNYPQEILELEREFEKLRESVTARQRE